MAVLDRSGVQRWKVLRVRWAERGYFVILACRWRR